MKKVDITLVTKDYDHLQPLACGDVQVEDVNLTLQRDTPGALTRTQTDMSIDGGELSFSRYMIRLAGGDRSLVGIPFFPTRGFRQRCFFVLRQSGFKSLQDMAGKRIGTNEWPATGNTWTRAVLREQGVAIEGISWWVGPIDNPNAARRPQGTLPPNVKLLGQDQNLKDMLLGGELDALMCPVPPSGFYAPRSPFVRLIPNYRKAEREYYKRTGLYPAHHLITVRRPVYEKHPWVLRNLLQAFDASKKRWQANRFDLDDTSPWLLADLEDTMKLIGPDWNPAGVEPNLKMIQALCDEELAQGLITRPLPVSEVFVEFEQVMKG